MPTILPPPVDPRVCHAPLAGLAAQSLTRTDLEPIVLAPVEREEMFSAPVSTPD